MPQLPSREGMAPATRVLLRFAAALFVLFWAAIIGGKLHISFGFSQLPLIPEIALALLLALTLGLALGACLLEEQRRADDAPADNTTTEGDVK